jgi:hypothetical protein
MIPELVAGNFLFLQHVLHTLLFLDAQHANVLKIISMHCRLTSRSRRHDPF